MANLGHRIDKLTVRNILRRHHLEPAPQRRQGGMSWAQFLKLHWEVLAATDFFTVEVATWHGLVTYYVLVVMELATRRVQIAGITPASYGGLHAAMRPAVDRSLRGIPPGQALSDPRPGHEIHAGVRCACSRPAGWNRSSYRRGVPNLNAHCERFVRSIKEEALEQMVMLGERALYYVIHQYLAHYHTERNHQGLDNQLIAPEGGSG